MIQPYSVYIIEIHGYNDRYYMRQKSKRYKVSLRGGRCAFEGTFIPFNWKEFAQNLREDTAMTAENWQRFRVSLKGSFTS